MGQYYEIRVKGHLDLTWSEWLGGLTIVHEANGDSTLTGQIPDQAALHGLLTIMRDMGMTFISINPIAQKSNGDQEAVNDQDEPLNKGQ